MEREEQRRRLESSDDSSYDSYENWLRDRLEKRQEDDEKMMENEKLIDEYVDELVYERNMEYDPKKRAKMELEYLKDKWYNKDRFNSKYN